MLITLLLAAAAAAATPPPAPIPDTPAGRRFADLMALTDAGDTAGIGTYVRDHFSEGMKKANPGDPAPSSQ